MPLNARPRVYAYATSEAEGKPRVFTVPSSAEEAANQAQKVIEAEYAEGVERHRVELLLPLIGATDIDDWPGGVRQQFKAALPMVESILQGLRTNLDLPGKFEVKVLDQGDAVGVWYNESILVVLFPTADTLNEIEELAEGRRLVLMINEQWRGGQVVSDFGFFGRQRKEAFVNSFKNTYSLASKRICGEDIRTLRMGDKTQLFVRERGEMNFLGEWEELPNYFEIERLLQGREGSLASMGIMDRMQSEMAFNADSLKQPDQPPK